MSRGQAFIVCALLYTTSLLLPGLTAGPAEADEKGDDLTVWFSSSIVTLPAGQEIAELSAVEIESPDLPSLLEAFETLTVAKTFPQFQAADTLMACRTGELINLPNYSQVFTITLPSYRDVDSLIAALALRSDVLLVERIGYPVFHAKYPNDPLFADGSQYGLNNFGQAMGAAGADIEAPLAWGLSTGGTGAAAVRIGLIDAGATNDHPDLAGRIISTVSDPEWLSTGEAAGHGFTVAGIAAANSDNHIGIAGVDWNASIVSKYIGEAAAPVSVAAKINEAISVYAPDNVAVLNHSYTMQDRTGQFADSSILVGRAIASAYNFNIVSVAGMGNYNGYNIPREFPAAYPQGIIAVGAVDSTGARWDQSGTGGSGSKTGSHIDVVAPGVGIMTTDYLAPTGYRRVTGTSFATPFVSGIAALMLGKSPGLYNDDVEHLIQLSADDMNPPLENFDVQTGWGRANARRALEYLSPLHVMKQGVATTDPISIIPDAADRRIKLASGSFTMNLLYLVRRYTVRQAVSFAVDSTGGAFQSVANLSVWGRGGGFATKGFASTADSQTNYATRFCELVPGTLSTSGCVMQTYVYFVYAINGYLWGIAPGDVECAWTAFERRPGLVPDAAMSYYTPQADSSGAVLDGLAAARNFRTCPNNHLQVRNPRVKVVVKDASGAAIPGIGRDDIFILMNGGTAAQGFANVGADSLISNSTYDPNCPDLRTILAESPTDANGTTYISLFGDRNASGVSIRDPARKFGHYDTEVPIFILGQKINGRLTPSAANGSYTFQLKNMDFVAGLGTDTPLYETVEVPDFNVFVYLYNSPYSYATHWRADFDGDGQLGVGDYNLVAGHQSHDCDYPNSP